MTTINDDLLDRLARLGPSTLEQGVEIDINADATGVFPKFEDWFTSSTPKVSYGAEYTSLSLGGGFDNLELNTGDPVASQQTRNRAITTASGHTLEMDDTAGNERIILKHNSGNGIEVRSDGSMVIAAGSQIISVTRDQNIIIEGNATLVYGGNLDMQVAGDYNLSVAGDYNLSVGENRSENTEGSYRTTTEGNEGRIVKGNNSETILGTSTSTILGDNNTVTKGQARFSSEGNMRIATGATATISAKTNLFQSSDNMNIAASSMSLFGATGTIGGVGVLFSGQGAIFEEGVTAPTFHGDLTGRADEAIASDTAVFASKGGGPGGADGWTNGNTATPTIVKPNSEILSNYLNNTPTGAVDVKVDIGGHLMKALNRSDATEGLGTRDLTTGEIRSILRTEGASSLTSFIGDAIGGGRLSPSYTKKQPPEVRRLASSKQEPYRGNNQAGSSMPGLDGKFLAPDDLTDFKFTSDIVIKSNDTITRTTKVSEGINLATFLGVVAKGRLNKISIANRPQIARNIQPNAELVKRIRSNRESEFKNHRLIIAEGIYAPTGAEEALSGWQESVNRYRSEGRAVVYELHNSKGKIDVEKTFDLAVYLKTVTSFEKIILDYDSYNTDGTLNTQLIFITPKLNEKYDPVEGTWSKSVETRFNGKVVTNTDLIEFNEEEYTLL